MSDFDLAGAKQAGYSDAEIADYLGGQQKFDVAGARKSGWQDADIITHLTGVPNEQGVVEKTPVTDANNWLTSRFVGAASNAAGTPNVVGKLAAKLPDPLQQQYPFSLLNRAGNALPSGQDIKDWYYRNSGTREVNTPGEFGPAIDAGTEAAMGAVAGGPRALLPAFVGGAGQQLVGDIPGIKGTGWEAPARFSAALVGGAGAAGLQQGGAAAGRIFGNLAGAGWKDAEKTASDILQRALRRDKTTFGELAGNQAPGVPLVVGGGENVKGALRGSTAAPGEARTITNETFDKYLEGSEGRVSNAISQNVSDKPPLFTRQSELEGEQSPASREAYERAGVPKRPEMLSPERTIKWAADQPAATIPAEWNTPTINSPKLDDLIAKSADIQTAIGNARKLPDFKDVPVNSMSMLDKIYKHLGGLEQEAIRGGNGTRANDLNNLRTDFKTALVDANPRYGRALNAYSEPQQLIDAANQGKQVFQSNVRPDEVADIYGKMPADQRKEFLGGVADWLRQRIGNTDRANPAERIWNSANNRQRTQAILSPDDYAKFDALMEQEKRVAETARKVTTGSRTFPMIEEAKDNSATLGILGKVAAGHYGGAALDIIKGISGRALQGRTEAVNAKLAGMLTETDPAKVGLVQALAARAQAAETARRQALQKSYLFGSLAPTSGAGASQ